MGAVDLVIQVESPKSVTRGLQRIGRAGHGIGETSKGRIFPKYRGDLLECAVVARRMREGEIEETMIPQNPLDVLAQHLVSMAALDEWKVDDVEKVVIATESFHDLSREQLENVLDMLDGRYPSDRFAELRPRIVWDRMEGTIHGRKGSRQLVVTNAGTIPDRGLYGVHLPDGRRVGELDEEMVYEARPGQTFLLGASTWRIEEITRDRVIVTPAPGAPGAVPFWRGDGVGRPAELGKAIGAFAREAVNREPAELAKEYDLDARAANNLVTYLREQQDATRVVPSDETIVVERFRDEIGDWRLCILSPYGGRVHAAWGLALAAKIRNERDLEADAIWSDDGIVIHLPDADEPPPADLVLVDPAELEDLIVGELSGSALFGARFRENASRSLLIPRAYPGKRTPLWQQRLKSQSLLEVARDFPRFPVILETYRECLQDVLDLPALTEHPGKAARALALAGRGRNADRLALRLLAPLRLRRDLHVRRGHAERRAAGGGAGARPRPAARAAGPGGAARTDRPGGAGRSRRAAPAPHRGGQGRRPRRAPAAAPQHRRPDHRGGGGAGHGGLLGEVDAGEAGRGTADREGADRRRRALDRLRGRRALPRLARRAAAARAAGDLPRGPPRRDARAGPPLRAHPRPLPDRAADAALRRRPRPGAARAGGRRGAGPRRAPPRRHRARVVRLRRAAPGPPRLAGAPAQGGRGGRPHRPRPLPAELAERRRLPRGRRARPPARGAGAAAGRRADAESLGERRPAAAARRLLAELARPALHQRRGDLDRRRAASGAATAASPSTSARTSASPGRRPPTASWRSRRGRSTTRSASGSPPGRPSGSTSSPTSITPPRTSTTRSGTSPGRAR